MFEGLLSTYVMKKFFVQLSLLTNQQEAQVASALLHCAISTYLIRLVLWEGVLLAILKREKRGGNAKGRREKLAALL